MYYPSLSLFLCHALARPSEKNIKIKVVVCVCVVVVVVWRTTEAVAHFGNKSRVFALAAENQRHLDSVFPRAHRLALKLLKSKCPGVTESYSDGC